MKLHSHGRRYWQLMTAGQGRLSFLQGCDPGEATCVLVDGPTLVLLPVALNRLRVFALREKDMK